MIIDCMMNIPLLYWAAKEAKDPRYQHIAISHAKTAQKYVVREDGSCNHIVAINPPDRRISGQSRRPGL